MAESLSLELRREPTFEQMDSSLSLTFGLAFDGSRVKIEISCCMEERKIESGKRGKFVDSGFSRVMAFRLGIGHGVSRSLICRQSIDRDQSSSRSGWRSWAHSVLHSTG